MIEEITQLASENKEMLQNLPSEVISEETEKSLKVADEVEDKDKEAESSKEEKATESNNEEESSESDRKLRKRKPVVSATKSKDAKTDGEPVQKKSRSEILKEKRDLEKEKKEAERLQREAEREEERVKRELVKEEERRRKEEERLARENEKKQRDQAKEEEKRLKAQQREDEKRKRDQEKEEEKKKKDDEKRQKDLEREQLRILKESEKEEKRKQREQAKEDERRKKEEEIASKERQQKRIASFFSVKPEKKDPVVAKIYEEKVVSDFDKCFLPFYVKADAKMYPLSKFFPTPTTIPMDDSTTSTATTTTTTTTTTEPDIKTWLGTKRKPRGYTPQYTALSVVNMINQIDNLEEKEDEIIMALSAVPYKILQFVEDIRPPYMGTFSRQRLGGLDPTNPYFTDDPKINYDYDSEVEWVEEDEDGEDLDGEDDDDDIMDEEDDDLDEFLEREDGSVVGGTANGNGNNGNSRRMMIGPLVPVTEWNDGTKPELFKPLQLEVLSHLLPVSIDPLHDYWVVKVGDDEPMDNEGDGKPMNNKGDKETAEAKTTVLNGSSSEAGDDHQPAKTPAKRKPRAKKVKTEEEVSKIETKDKITTVKSKKTTKDKVGSPAGTKATKTKRTTTSLTIPEGDSDHTEKRLPAKIVGDDTIRPFLKMVQKSDMNQILLVEILKKEFPSVSKEVIRNTLRELASRVGVKEADKVWIVNETTWAKYFSETE